MGNDQRKCVGRHQVEMERSLRPGIGVWMISLLQVFALHWVTEGVFLTTGMLFVVVLFCFVNQFIVAKAWGQIHKLKEMKKAGTSITFPETNEERKFVLGSLMTIIMPIALFPFQLTTTYIATHQKGLYEATSSTLLFGLVESLLMMFLAVTLFAVLYQMLDATERLLSHVMRGNAEKTSDSVSLTNETEGLQKASREGFEAREVFELLKTIKGKGLDHRMEVTEIILINQQLSALDAIMEAYSQIQVSSQPEVRTYISDYLLAIKVRAEEILYKEDAKHIEKIKRKVERMKENTLDAV